MEVHAIADMLRARVTHALVADVTSPKDNDRWPGLPSRVSPAMVIESDSDVPIAGGSLW